MNNLIKLIRSRLDRAGIKGVSGETIKSAILKYSDTEELTEGQKDLVTAELIEILQPSDNNLVTRLSSEPVETEATENIESTGIVFTEPTESLVHTQGTEFDKLTDSTDINPSKQDIDLVSQMLEEFNLKLGNEGIIAIASQVDRDIDSITERRRQITQAITAYIAHKFDTTEKEYNSSVEDLISYSNRRKEAFNNRDKEVQREFIDISKRNNEEADRELEHTLKQWQIPVAFSNN